MLKKLVAIAGVAAALGVALTAAPAEAATNANGSCESWYYGELCLYYDGNLTGAVYDYTGDIADYGTRTFLGTADGHGLPVKNDAASARDVALSYNYTIYYNENWTGPADTITHGTWKNLVNTWNENASQQGYDSQ